MKRLSRIFVLILASFITFSPTAFAQAQLQQTNSGVALNALNSKPGDIVSPSDFGAVNNGVTDDTDALNKAIAAAAATSKTLLLKGRYAVTTLKLHGSSSNPLNVSGNFVINGIAASATPALLDVNRYVNMSGQIGLWGAFNANYGAGIWFHGIGGAGAQYANFYNVSPAGFLIGWRFGDIKYPNAIISEVTVFGGHTYGTPVAVQVEGANTVVHFIGASPLDSGLAATNTKAGWFSGTSTTSVAVTSSGAKTFMTQTGLRISTGMPIEARPPTAAANYMTGTVSSYDSGTGALVMSVNGAAGTGTFTSWILQPAMAAIRSIGAQIKVTGGEIQQPAQISNLIEIRPLEPVPGNKLAQWGSVSLVNVSNEAPGIELSTINPGNLSIDTAHYGTFTLDGAVGYVGQDVAPYLNTTSDFYGRIFLRSNNLFTARIPRANFNISAGSKNTIIYTDSAGLGPNFKDAYAGIRGGTVQTGPVAAIGTKWTTWKPSLSASSGTISSLSFSNSRYGQTGQTTCFKTGWTIRANGTGAGFLRVTLPTTPNDDFTAHGYDANGKMIYAKIVGGSTVMDIAYYDGTYPGADGHKYDLSGCYESR